MSKFTLVLLLMVSGMLLSGCGGTQVTPPIEPTLSPTNTNTPAPTETPTPTVEATPPETPTQVIPTNPPDCVNSASFVSDVTIVDNSQIEAGSTFTKTWRIRNTGTCVWTPDYYLDHYSANLLGFTARIPLTVTYPGEEVDISIDMTAPTTLGTAQGNFVVKNPAGLIMSIDQDSRLWALINVIQATSGGAATEVPPTPSASGGSGTAVPANAPGLATVSCAFTTDATRASQVATIVNNYRAQNGLPALMVNTLLARAAQAHANDMACNQLFYHNGSNGSTPATRVAAVGYQAAWVTENVHGRWPPYTPEEVVTWWRTDQIDPRHNENLLSTKHTEIGVGYSFFNNYGYYVIVFAAP